MFSQRMLDFGILISPNQEFCFLKKENLCFPLLLCIGFPICGIKGMWNWQKSQKKKKKKFLSPSCFKMAALSVGAW